jgi:hypothetical protein
MILLTPHPAAAAAAVDQSSKPRPLTPILHQGSSCNHPRVHPTPAAAIAAIAATTAIGGGWRAAGRGGYIGVRALGGGSIAALKAERLLLLLLALLLLCLHCKGVVLVGELGAWEGLPTLSSVLLRSRISRRKGC